MPCEDTGRPFVAATLWLPSTVPGAVGDVATQQLKAQAVGYK